MAKPKPASASKPVVPRSHTGDWLATAGAALVMLAFAVSLVFIVRGPHQVGAFDVESDFYGGYAPAAVDLAHGRMLNEHGRLPALYGFVGPLYPALLAAGGVAHPDVFEVAESLSVLAAVVTLLAWFLLLRRRLGAFAGFVAIVLLATNPVFLRYGYSVTTDATALMFQSLAMLLWCTSAGTAAALGAGALTGLALLTRYNSVYLLPAAALVLFTGGTEHRERGRALAFYALGALALALPWQVFARTHGGEMQFHQLLAFDVYARAQGMDWDAFLQNVWPRYEHAPMTVLTSDPARVARRLLFNLTDHARNDARLLLGMPLAWAAALMPLLAIFDQRVRRAAPLVGAGMLAYLALLPAAHNERYSLMLLPYAVAMAAATLTVWPWARSEAVLMRAARVAVVVALAVPAARASLKLQSYVLDQQPLETLRCAERLRALARSGDRAVARKPNFAFHAGVGAVYFPPVDSLPALAAHMRAEHARWLFFSTAEAQLRPAMAFLLDTTANVPGLTRRAVERSAANLDGLDWQRLAVLYEAGPDFGTAPTWWSDPRERTLHTLRGMAA
ncbi:MAG: glycosyltransferase family 39 protein, partial [Candidatus Eisenbacteria bacterium]